MEFILIGLIVSAIIGGISTASTNSTNRRIARETNDLNMQNYREQRQHDEDMYEKEVEDNKEFWNMQNEYNTYENQVARARDAGLNPSFVVGGSNTAGSITSASHSSTPVPQMQGYNYQSPLGGIGDSLLQFLPMISGLMNDSSLRGLQGSQTDQTNTFTPLLAEGFKLDNASKEVVNAWQPKLLEQDYLSRSLNNWITDQTKVSRVQQQFAMEAKVKAEERIATMSADNMEKLQKFVEPQAMVKFMTEVEELAYIKANRLVSEKTYDKLKSEIAKNYAQARDYNASAQNKEDQHEIFVETKDEQVETVKNNASITANNAKEIEETIDSEIAKIISENKLSTIINDSGSIFFGNSFNSNAYWRNKSGLYGKTKSQHKLGIDLGLFKYDMDLSGEYGQ